MAQYRETYIKKEKDKRLYDFILPHFCYSYQHLSRSTLLIKKQMWKKNPSTSVYPVKLYPLFLIGIGIVFKILPVFIFEDSK